MGDPRRRARRRRPRDHRQPVRRRPLGRDVREAQPGRRARPRDGRRRRRSGDRRRRPGGSEAFEDGVWSQIAPRKRKHILLGYADAILDRKEELALVSTLEMGKPIADSVGEVSLTAQCIAYYAEAIDKVYGEVGRRRPTRSRS